MWVCSPYLMQTRFLFYVFHSFCWFIHSLSHSLFHTHKCCSWSLLPKIQMMQIKNILLALRCPHNNTSFSKWEEIFQNYLIKIHFDMCAVWSDWVIYWHLGTILKPLATINLSKSPTFFEIFCQGVKIDHFSSEIIFRQLL